MAMLRSKAPKVGTTQWVLNERSQAQLFIDQETEEFSFAAKNDMEWLNEHMAEIFSRTQLHVADVFKTPGKLRGKTPRTARKRMPLEARAPLTDIFAPNTQNTKSPAHNTTFYKNVTKLQNSDISTQAKPNTSPGRQPLAPAPGKENKPTDSGYHGLPEDEMDVDRASKAVPTQDSPLKILASSSPQNHGTPEWKQDERTEEGRTTDGSFVSAKEAFGKKSNSTAHHRDEDEITVPDDAMDIDAAIPQAATDDENVAPDMVAADENDDIEKLNKDKREQAESTTDTRDVAQNEDQMELDDAQSPSDTSSPGKPLLRKSSLTFAALPAREPLGKMSVGNRTSYIDQHRTPGVRSGSQVGNWNGARSMRDSQQPNQTEPHDDIYVDEDGASHHKSPSSESTKKLKENATRRLHERITMLGQSKEPRPSKSIPSLATTTQNVFSQSTKAEAGAESKAVSTNIGGKNAVLVMEDDDDDWIAPIAPQKNSAAPHRPHLAKSSSADVMEKISGKETIGEFDRQQPTRSMTAERPRTSPIKAHDSGYKTFEATTSSSTSSSGRPTTPGEGALKKTGSVSYPDLASAAGFVESSTPAGSPHSKRHPDGPLSASKAKLYSVLKSAKGIFASSAGVSAQAKMETLSPSVTRSKRLAQPPSMDQLAQPNDTEEPPTKKQAVANPSKIYEGRKTRSSTEREEKRKEKEAKEQRIRDEQLAKVREQERLKAASQKVQRTAMEEHTQQAPAIDKAALSGADEVADRADQMPPPAIPKSGIPSSQSQKPRRPMKPTKGSAPKAQPAPVAIRLPSQSKRIGQAPSATASQSSLQDSLSSSQSKQPGPVSKATSSSLQSSTSSNNLKTSTSGPTKPSSLQAAARKKEMEEKSAQRKAEQKRELERKRAAKQEEERRRIAAQEEERRQEQQRKAAEREEQRRQEQQRKAAEQEEQRRQEQQRKAAEQQRLQEAREAAQRKALEQRRVEQQRLEQQRAQMLAKQKQASDLAAKLQQEKAQAQALPPRADLGAARPVSRFNTVQDQLRPVPHPPINPAKPAKRPKPEDEDEQASRPAVQRTGPSYQQTEGKRRKTDEEDEEEIETRHSVKAPPIRHSNIRKDQQKFPHGYTNAPQPAAHPQQKYWTSMAAQQQMQQTKTAVHPNDMAKFSSAKIPFAEVQNPPAGPSSSSHAPNPPNYKTPARGSQNQPSVINSTTTKVPLKSSPQYTPGEEITLPDIDTDSDSESSDDDSDAPPRKKKKAFRQPSWANSPALRELLLQQQLIDPETIFGPIAPLQMEEVFRNKDRQKRFRDRTSSANWSGADRLTEEEKRRDREGRERVARDGGWTYKASR
ncbi:MAG: hypothetical protein M1821_002617 [Bathelium mastoideum]|nr:MAG: hypothetical protein M1821_002617 [Bathelium mastoideum]KAI9685522.1 MAG: hypothetical protein M1822_004380 [Bathelium mastoideum]